MKSISDVIKEKSLKPDRHNTKEFQAFGNMLAEELGDVKHRALYIKMAKTENRGLLEAARSFVKDSRNTTTKGRLFMWKMTQLKKEKELKAHDK